jgi:hypothetical protein
VRGANKDTWASADQDNAGRMMAGVQVPVFRLLCIAVQCVAMYSAVQCVTV